jgi:hypothetical protein
MTDLQIRRLDNSFCLPMKENQAEARRTEHSEGNLAKIGWRGPRSNSGRFLRGCGSAAAWGYGQVRKKDLPKRFSES